jgi:hypothetical protein
VASVEEAEGLAMPADFDYLDHLQNQYRRSRGYTPALLETFDFKAAPPAEPVLEAIGGVRIVNDLEPTIFTKLNSDAPRTHRASTTEVQPILRCCCLSTS